MITKEELRDRLHEVPFRPFRISMSDGRQYDVPNHDAACVGRLAIMVGIGLEEDSFAQRWVHCAILHITSVEDLKPSSGKRKKAKAQ
jgi:hypothetical protein